MWNNKNRKITTCLRALNQLTQELFFCYVAGDYLERQYFYERQFHISRKKFLCAIIRLRQTMLPDSSAIVAHLETNYEIILSLGLLLYRIQDHSTFGVASKELTAIAENIDAFFHYLIALLCNKKLPSRVDSFNENIQQLEEVNHNALRVVASDPMAFLLFIHDLKSLENNLMQLTTFSAGAS